MERIILNIIKFYQNFFSQFLRVIFGSSFGGCRFYPTCSEYAEQAVAEYGGTRGFWLALGRILRCNPLFEGGLDTVTTNYGHTNKK